MPDDSRLDLSALTRAADDLLSVRRVFGEPYAHEGTLVVPVAKVMGGHAAADAHGDARLGLRRGARGGPTAPGVAAASPAPGAEGPADDLPAQAGDGGSGAPAGSPEVAARGLWHGRPGHGLSGARPSGRGGAQADAGAFAARVKPLGVYVIAADGVRWQPALDLNRVILGGQVVGAVAVLALSWALRRRRR